MSTINKFEYENSDCGLFANQQLQFLRRNRTAALRLPPSSETFAAAEIDMPQGDIIRFKQQGIIHADSLELVEYENGDSRGTNRRTRWRVAQGFYKWIRANLPGVAECPGAGCHATGVRNPRDAEGYRCTNDDCGYELSRAEAKELIG